MGPLIFSYHILDIILYIEWCKLQQNQSILKYSKILVLFCCEIPQTILEFKDKDKLKLMADLSFTPSLPKDEDFDCYSSISDR